MKITNIRVNGRMPTDQDMRDIVLSLQLRIGQADFLTNVTQVNATHIKLSQHSRSFSIDTTKLPHNIQYSMSSPNGKRTNLPTWDQRVTYNCIVNNVLDELNVSANVTSGPFTIREGLERYTEADWYDQVPSWVNENINRGFYIGEPSEFSRAEFNKRQGRAG